MKVRPMSFPEESKPEIVKILVRGSSIDICGCWVWEGHGRHGYGSVSLPGIKSSQWAHRVSYAVLVGDIEEDMVIDHVCRNRACWRPDHLRKSTHQENCKAIHRRRVRDVQHSLFDLELDAPVFAI